MLTLTPGRDKDGGTELAATLLSTEASTFRLTVTLERDEDVELCDFDVWLAR
jgi:hypothetical protein